MKTSAWTHNTYINKLGYSLFKLVIGKAVTLLGLSRGIVVSESVTDAEVMRTIIKTISRMIAEIEIGFENNARR